eukprot:CAMPEP_0115355924 /NCGR_PEP_ID=MMETSP0270-20121206/99346_1 /TAXON_ID=71861 /ORGANISM="Scrippsiella trochoidea, Strain CCMP3099" /LENGTH=47 /DNA_ID= /DNA_START= /DNA_END= /DNA_ORIENTATION=
MGASIGTVPGWKDVRRNLLRLPSHVEQLVGAALTRCGGAQGATAQRP